MPSPASLDEEIQRARLDNRHERSLLQKLLTVNLYVHSPLEPHTDRLNICMFDRPDGLRVIPVFTDLEKAKVAGRGKVLSVPVPGRALFEATRGATLMLNPNHVSCTLYPEEISALLDGGIVGHVQAINLTGDEMVRFSAPTVPCEDLATHLAQTLARIHVVERAYLAEAHWRDRDPSVMWYVTVLAPALYGERIGRAIATAMQKFKAFDRALDVQVISPEDALPGWIAAHCLAPIYDRSASPSLRAANRGRP